MADQAEYPLGNPSISLPSDHRKFFADPAGEPILNEDGKQVGQKATFQYQPEEVAPKVDLSPQTEYGWEFLCEDGTVATIFTDRPFQPAISTTRIFRFKVSNPKQDHAVDSQWFKAQQAEFEQRLKDLEATILKLARML
jgi:hypothetical protein